MSKEKKNLNHINIWCYFAFKQESILLCTLVKMQGLLFSSFKLAERDADTAVQRGLVAFMMVMEDLQPQTSHVETSPSDSAMHVNIGTRVQKNGSRCWTEKSKFEILG